MTGTAPSGAVTRFAAELLRLRQALHLSQRALAAKVCYSETLIRKVEAGQRSPSKKLAMECDRVLQTGGVLIQLWRDVEAEVYQTDGRRQRWSHPTPEVTPQDGDLAGVYEDSQCIPPDRGSSRHVNTAAVIGAVDRVRHLVDEMFDDGTPGRSRLERLEKRVSQYARDILTTAPATSICHLGSTLADAMRLRKTSGRAIDGCRLNTVIARLSIMIANELAVLGDAPAAGSWCDTALVAAEASGDPGVWADVLALTAIAPLYHGNPVEAARTASQARMLAQVKPCVATALAPMLEAMAWAKAGNGEMARDALAVADRNFECLAPRYQVESAFGLSPRRYLFFTGRSLTFLGDYGKAWQAHGRALDLYPDNVVDDPALIFLDRAASLVATGHVVDGAELVTTTILSLPPDHRGHLFINTALEVLDTIPARAERIPAVRACREVLHHLGTTTTPAIGQGAVVHPPVRKLAERSHQHQSPPRKGSASTRR